MCTHQTIKFNYYFTQKNVSLHQLINVKNVTTSRIMKQFGKKSKHASLSVIVCTLHAINPPLTICQNPSSDSTSSAYIGTYVWAVVWFISPIKVVLRDFGRVRRIRHVCLLLCAWILFSIKQTITSYQGNIVQKLWHASWSKRSLFEKSIHCP